MYINIYTHSKISYTNLFQIVISHNHTQCSYEYSICVVMDIWNEHYYSWIILHYSYDNGICVGTNVRMDIWINILPWILEEIWY